MTEDRVPVDVIVPAFRDLERTRVCLESVLSSRNETRFHLLVANDASPDPELVEWLRARASGSAFELIEHEVNRGFVATVNECMRLHPDRDVVVLNSDTEVANNWLDRLVACAAREERAGTITPFSNNATICSFPLANVSNPMPAGWSTARLDSLFARVNAGLSVAIPTAVGFCMFIRRACLDAVGYFDEARFGRGYGEENDFCLRAEALGWTSLLCADTFVFHAGGVSFGAEAPGLQAAAAKVMEELHPGYHGRIRAFVEQDPIAPVRARAADVLLMQSLVDTVDQGPCVVHVLGMRGGGSAAHVRQLVNLPGAAVGRCHLILFVGEAVAVLEDVRTGWFYPLDITAGAGSFARVLHRGIGVGTVHWHLINDWTLELSAALRGSGVREVVTLHDIGFSSRVAFAEINRDGSEGGEEQWLARVREFLEGAAAVLAPSHFIAELCRFATSGSVSPRVVAHPADFPTPTAPLVPDAEIRERCQEAGFSSDGSVVALVGALGEHKGTAHWRALRALALQRNDNLNWVLVGYSDPELMPVVQERCVIHGAYLPEELPALLAAYRAAVVYFPPGTPESFSYALSDVWIAGWPVVVHPLGALGERVSQHPEGGVILSPELDPAETLNALLDLLGQFSILAGLQANVRAAARSWLNAPEDVAKVMADVWMNEMVDVRAVGLNLIYAQVLRTHLDERCFRIELTRLSAENSELVRQNARLVDGLAEVRELAHQRELWAQKLEGDIAELRVGVERAESRCRDLESRLAECEESARRLVEMNERLKAESERLSAEDERLAGEEKPLFVEGADSREKPFRNLAAWVFRRLAGKG